MHNNCSYLVSDSLAFSPKKSHRTEWRDEADRKRREETGVLMKFHTNL